MKSTELAAFVRGLVAAGASADVAWPAIVDAVSKTPSKSSGAARQQRYREREKASQNPSPKASQAASHPASPVASPGVTTGVTASRASDSASSSDLQGKEAEEAEFRNQTRAGAMGVTNEASRDGVTESASRESVTPPPSPFGVPRMRLADADDAGLRVAWSRALERPLAGPPPMFWHFPEELEALRLIRDVAVREGVTMLDDFAEQLCRHLGEWVASVRAGGRSKPRRGWRPSEFSTWDSERDDEPEPAPAAGPQSRWGDPTDAEIARGFS